MPPRLLSRYQFTEQVANSDDKLLLSERIPFRFRPLVDNIQHRVGAGDTLFNLASRFYKGMERPAKLWWVIADFQPIPIFDPTIKLSEGAILWVPSLRTVDELVFSDTRYDESEQ